MLSRLSIHYYRLRPIAVITTAAAAILITVSCSTVGTSDVTSPKRITGPVAAPQPVIQQPTATTEPTLSPTAAPTAVPTAKPASIVPVLAVTAVPGGGFANELGTIPILETHVIANAEEDQWTITPEHFRKSIQELYDAGYRPISMADLLDRKIDLPAGKSPVLLTFDDSSPGQFRYIEQNGTAVVDPDSAVGMLEAFHNSHPDWALKGVFYVLPEAAEPHKLFGQKKYEAQKLRYLVDHGFEIGNHTWWHQRLDTVNDQEVQRQLAFAVRDIQKAVPGYNVRSMALPLGLWPKNRALAFDGSYQGASYHNDAVLMVGAEPAPSPYSKKFDPRELPRVQLFDNNLERWIAYLSKHPEEHYVSDGNPQVVSFPRKLQPELDPTTVRGKQINLK